MYLIINDIWIEITYYYLLYECDKCRCLFDEKFYDYIKTFLEKDYDIFIIYDENFILRDKKIMIFKKPHIYDISKSNLYFKFEEFYICNENDSLFRKIKLNKICSY